MTDRKYNGWTNYETWVVNLWMDNEEGTYDYWREVAEDIYKNEAEEPIRGGLGMTKRDDAVYLLADRLKNDHEDRKDEILHNLDLTASVWADLLGAALSETNWQEIAGHIIDAVTIEA